MEQYANELIAEYSADYKTRLVPIQKRCERLDKHDEIFEALGQLEVFNDSERRRCFVEHYQEARDEILKQSLT